MSNRSIKVSDKAYNGIRALMQPRESYSDVIERMIHITRILIKVMVIATPGQHNSRTGIAENATKDPE